MVHDIVTFHPKLIIKINALYLDSLNYMKTHNGRRYQIFGEFANLGFFWEGDNTPIKNIKYLLKSLDCLYHYVLVNPLLLKGNFKT